MQELQNNLDEVKFKLDTLSSTSIPTSPKELEDLKKELEEKQDTIKSQKQGIKTLNQKNKELNSQLIQLKNITSPRSSNHSNELDQQLELAHKKLNEKMQQ